MTKPASDPNEAAHSVPITEPMRQITLAAIRDKHINKTLLARKLGLGKPWVTKFLDGTLRSIKLETLQDLEESLGISYFTIEPTGGKRSPLANRIATAIDNDRLFSKLVITLDEALAHARRTFTPAYIPTADMTKIGQQIIRIAFAHEDKPGKVCRLVLELLSGGRSLPLNKRA